MMNSQNSALVAGKIKSTIGKFKILNLKQYPESKLHRNQCYIKGVSVKAGDIIELDIYSVDALEVISSKQAAPISENAKKRFPHAVEPEPAPVPKKTTKRTRKPKRTSKGNDKREDK